MPTRHLHRNFKVGLGHWGNEDLSNEDLRDYRELSCIDFGKISWRRKWQPTPVFFPGKSHGRRSLAGYSPGGCKELDRTERLHFHFLSLLMYSVLPFVPLFKNKDGISVMGIQHILKWSVFPGHTSMGRENMQTRTKTWHVSRNGAQHWKHLYHNSEEAGINAIFSKNMQWYIAQ